MRAVFILLVGALLLGGCSSRGIVSPSSLWSPPPLPSVPPPITVERHFGLPPPVFPQMERRKRIPGEVLLEVEIDENHRLSRWKLVRASTEGYARAVLATMSNKGRAPKVAPGVYSYCVVFTGPSKHLPRPGTTWIVFEADGPWSQ